MWNAYEWCAAGRVSEIQNLSDLPLSLIDHWIERFTTRGSGHHQLGGRPAGRRARRRVRGAVRPGHPVARGRSARSDGRLVGYMGADDPKKGRLEIIEKPLVSLASFISASMKRAMAERQVDELTMERRIDRCVLAQRVPSRLRLRDVREHRVRAGDADRLAVVNRERSRDEGDEVLRRICSSMRRGVRRGVYRLGDDEFCAVALPLEYEEFDRMTRSLTARFAEAGLPASVGLAWSERCEDATRAAEHGGRPHAPRQDRAESGNRSGHRLGAGRSGERPHPPGGARGRGGGRAASTSSSCLRWQRKPVRW